MIQQLQNLRPKECRFLDLLIRLLAVTVPLKYNEQVTTDLYKTMVKELAEKMRQLLRHNLVHLEMQNYV